MNCYQALEQTGTATDDTAVAVIASNPATVIDVGVESG